MTRALRRELYGSRSERKARLLEQMELQLEDLETAASEGERAAETAATTGSAPAFARKRRPMRAGRQGRARGARISPCSTCSCVLSLVGDPLQLRNSSFDMVQRKNARLAFRSTIWTRPSRDCIHHARNGQFDTTGAVKPIYSC